MHRSFRKVALFCVLGLIASLTAITSVAQAASTINVQVGGDIPIGPNCNPQTFRGCELAEGTRFFPHELTVHKGDTINFNFAGFHTATLIPANQGADDWRHDNWEGIDKPYSIVIPDTDDGAGNFEFNRAVVAPSDSSCGTPSSNPCGYDGSAVVNSGFPQGDQNGFQPFSVTITADSGTHFWVLCLLHDTMQMRVDVVSDSTATTTQSDIDDAVSAGMDHDTRSANQLLFQMNQADFRILNGKRLWQVHAGFDTGHYSMMAMLPNVLHIQKGDKVEWHFAGLFKENHSVVFNSKTANTITNGPPPQCETSSGDVPATQDPTTGAPTCADGSQPEFPIDSRLLTPAGDGKLTSASDYENSGLEGTGVSDAPFTLTFPKASGKQPFKYACGVHGGLMLGKIFVR